MTDFKITYDDIAEGVRLNDAMSDSITDDEDPIANVGGGLGTDTEALTMIAMGRSMMLAEAAAKGQLDIERSDIMAHVNPVMLGEIAKLAMISSAWIDGFFTALHIIEQKIDAGDLTTVE